MKRLTKKQILKNAEKRLNEMRMELLFSKNIYHKRPTNEMKIKIQLLQDDILELEGEIEIFKKENIFE